MESVTATANSDITELNDATLAAIDYGVLTRCHPEYQRWNYRWDDYRLAYKGGEEFMLAAGQQSRIVRASTAAGAAGVTASAALIPGSNTRIPRRFLWQLEGEPDAAYLTRLERAFPILYIGPMIDYFVHYLFAEKPLVRLVPKKEGAKSEQPELPDWFSEFDDDCTGSGVKLADFIRDVFKELCITRHTGILIGAPEDTSGMSQAAAEDAGIDGVILTAYKAEEILDWQKDEAGELKWVILRKIEHRREFPNERARYEVIRYVDRSVYATWEVVDGKNGAAEDKQVHYLGSVTHGSGTVPFEMPEIPEGLWIANKLFGWQLELFNQMQILSRGELLSCFIQPVLTSSDDSAQSRIFGDGTLLKLRGGGAKGESETFGWSSANVDPLKFLGERLDAKRDEGYRIAHQMSLAVDGNSATAVARSGLSKIEERRSTEIILQGFGGYMRAIFVRVLNKISKLIGDDSVFSCVGFDNFQVSSMEEELQTAALLQTLQIKSVEFNKDLQKKMARRVMDHADEAQLARYDKEIDDGFDAEQDQQQTQQGAQDIMTQAAVKAAQVNGVALGKNGAPPVPPNVKPPIPPGPQAKG